MFKSRFFFAFIFLNNICISRSMFWSFKKVVIAPGGGHLTNRTYVMCGHSGDFSEVFALVQGMKIPRIALIQGMKIPIIALIQGLFYRFCRKKTKSGYFSDKTAAISPYFGYFFTKPL